MATAIAPAAHGRGVTHAPASAAATVRERLPALIRPGQKRKPETSTASASVAKVSPSRWRRQLVNSPRDLAEACREAPQSLQNTHWRRLTEWLNAWQPVVAKQVASHSEGDSAKPSRVMPGIVERSGCARLVQHGPSKGATAQYRGTMVVVVRVVVVRVVVVRVVVVRVGRGDGSEVMFEGHLQFHLRPSRRATVTSWACMSVNYAPPKSKLLASEPGSTTNNSEALTLLTNFRTL